MEQGNKLIVFQDKEIRRIWHNEEWWFSILDVVEVLTDTTDPSQYFKRMRQRDESLKTYVGTNCTQIALEGKTGKKRKTTIANTKSFFLRLKNPFFRLLELDAANKQENKK